ncbi:ATP-dependent Clp protease ATP-binding subunit ClpX [Roseburia sp. MUC/MUC-530-WT-4D]|uniref:ATP-dependent Clp protease ATP-binding subunit ClpX n=1 Tax=Roseburia porci TaxID=2605790 RepID=A0A6L5YPC0_9FIRM|nr:ATP-dependent Clp protease ATP-binding subunit ClpX [Roseburia porci]MCI5516631.1 ATP-dependent Clp protease ATP-binding subunit ClpX [Roseburia sp.]MST74393.1 ATP-dependent Clp protease ATP-binding subunit ClpX [Roseburia porci]
MSDDKLMDIDSNQNNDDNEYEDVCYICRRPEHVAGKMIHIPNNICICRDCMQKTFDSMNSSGINMNDMMNMNLGSMPNISMINLSDLQNSIPNSQKLKKKKEKKEPKKAPVLDIHSIPAPHKIKASLDEYVVGQEHAKKVMSVAVYNHYKRIMENTDDGVEIEKSNMLMIGPTGSGKTYLVKTLAKLLDVPLAITDATSLTEAGYIGDDIESVVSKLLAAADNDVERAEHGIIFIDEIDKIAKKKNTNQRDVSGESVQQGMLKLLEGAEVEVPVGASSKNAMVPMTTVDTKDILFICGGAFPDLEEIIKERLNKEASIGFKADLKDKYDEEENLLEQVTVEDVRNFGMIPEFLGRLPILFSLEALTEDMLVRILREPKNAIIKQYQKLLAMDEVKLEFDDEALHTIAKRAKEKKVGARALRAIIEDFMLDIMYEIPKDDNIGSVTITKDFIEKKGGPLITMRGCAEIEDKAEA